MTFSPTLIELRQQAQRNFFGGLKIEQLIYQIITRVLKNYF